MTGVAGPLTVQAPAKINLFLRVLRRRRDGYHDLESLLVPISLTDRLVVHAESDPTGFRTLSLSLDLTGDPAMTRGVPVGESNLVLRAARLLAERAGVRGFADIDLEKRIPAADWGAEAATRPPPFERSTRCGARTFRRRTSGRSPPRSGRTSPPFWPTVPSSSPAGARWSGRRRPRPSVPCW